MAQTIQKVIQEDLNIGTGATWVTAPGGGELRSTQVGLHSVARGQKEYTATWAPGAIAAGSKASTTVTVPDAAVGDFVIASHDQMLTSNLRIMGHVSAANTAKVVIHNPTASSVTVASGTVSVLVFPAISQSTDPADPPTLLSFSWSQSSEQKVVSFATTIIEYGPDFWATGGTLTWSWGDGGADTVVSIDSDDLGLQTYDHTYSAIPPDDTYTVTLTIVGTSNGFNGLGTAAVTTDYSNGMSGSSGD